MWHRGVCVGVTSASSPLRLHIVCVERLALSIVDVGIGGDWWRGAETAVYADTFARAFFVYQDNHPDAD